ncbi:MAG: hypothetical protein AAF678_02995 [Pseudomonadota bacterium]
MLSTPQTILAVEALLCLPFLIMGISHLAQPRMWDDVFERLAQEGHAGVVKRSFLFELWPAILIVTFHQDWTFPGLFLTLYGHALAVKVTVSLVAPNIGLRSIEMPKTFGRKSFVPAGIVLCAMGFFCAMHVLGIWI